MFWTVRAAPGSDVTTTVRNEISKVDSDVAVAATSMNQYLSRAFAKRLFVVRILGAFAVAALFLAAAAAACILPIRKAIQSDPVECLRA